jgi:hypothetical protein
LNVIAQDVAWASECIALNYKSAQEDGDQMLERNHRKSSERPDITAAFKSAIGFKPIRWARQLFFENFQNNGWKLYDQQ